MFHNKFSFKEKTDRSIIFFANYEFYFYSLGLLYMFIKSNNTLSLSLSLSFILNEIIKKKEN